MVGVAIIKALIKGSLFCLYCLLGPFFKLQSLKKKRQCSPIDNQILLQSATEIARRIRKREVGCEEVITAYVKRCKEVNSLINAIVEDRFEAAIREAREIDEFLKSTTMDEARIAREKPLLGLPVTIKESIAVQGMSHSVGVKDTPSRATSDADVVAKVRQAGGIPLLVSNTPELCLWWHTFNKVTGTTKNPYDIRRTAGGSSGGEIHILAISGGTTIAQITRRSLEKVITNNYAKNFNWAGKAPKKAFKVLKMKDLIIVLLALISAKVTRIEDSFNESLIQFSILLTAAFGSTFLTVAAALLGAGASLLSLASDIGGSARLPAMFCGVFGHKPTPNWVSVEGHKPGAGDKNWSSFFAIGSMVRYASDLSLILTVMSQTDKARIGFNKKVRLEDMKFFYMDHCGSSVTSSVNSDIKGVIYKLIRYLETTYNVKVQKAYLEDMKSSLELCGFILLKIQDVYSMFNRSDDPKKSKNVFIETLKYFFFMSSHTFPAICYGIIKNICERLPVSKYNKLLETRMRLKKQFEELLGDNGILIFPSFISPAHYPHESLYNVCNYTYMMIFNVLGFPVTQCPLGFDKNQLPIGLQIVANPGCDYLTIAVAQEIERIFGGWREPSESKGLTYTM